MKRKAVLFVCLGNICRSPTAEAVFRALLEESGQRDDFLVDSAGTGDWHIGKAPHAPTLQAAADKGIDMSNLRARQVTPDDFQRFDFVLAMDRQNQMDLHRMQPEGFSGYLGNLTNFDPQLQGVDIADPYGGSPDDFARAFAHIYQATHAFYRQLNHEAQ